MAPFTHFIRDTGLLSVLAGSLLFLRNCQYGIVATARTWEEAIFYLKIMGAKGNICPRHSPCMAIIPEKYSRKGLLLGILLGIFLTLTAVFVLEYTEFLFGIILLWIVIPVMIKKLADRLMGRKN